MSIPPPANKAGNIACFLVALVAACVALMKWTPSQPGITPDEGWSWLLGEAWLHGMVWGRDVVFTYGPYGFLSTAVYDPRTYGLLLLFGFAVSLALTAGFWRVMAPGSRWKWIWPVVAAVLAGLLSLSGGVECAIYTLVFIAGLLAQRVQERESGNEPLPTDERSELIIDKVVLYGLAVLLGLTAHIKLGLGISAFITLAVFATGSFRRKKLPPPLMIFLFSALFFWIAAGQPLSAVADYLRYSQDVVSTYSESLGWPNAPWHVLVYLLSVALLTASLVDRVPWRRAIVIVLAMMAQALIVLKASFVRYDAPHSTLAPLVVFCWGVLALFTSLAKPARRPRVLASVAVGVALLLQFVSSQMFLRQPMARQIVELPGSYRVWAERAATCITGRADNERKRRESIAKIVATIPAPQIDGTVDIFPDMVSIPLAHGMRYTPRPLVQSYMPTSPALSGLDADFLSGPRGPEFVLFNVGGTDYRLPTMGDNRCWPILLSRFEPVGTAAGHVLLHRLPVARAMRVSPLSSGRVRLDEEVALPPMPPGAFLWIKLDVKQTLLGRIATALYQPPMLVIKIITADGEAHEQRLPRLIARDGFIVSPLMLDVRDYARVVLGQSAASMTPVKFSVTGIGSPDITPMFRDVHWAYAEECGLVLERYDVAIDP